MRLRAHEDQILSLLDTVVSLAGRNFTSKAKVTGNNELLDALALGLNMLAEEIEASTVGRDYFNDLFQAMGSPLLVCAPDGTLLMVNQSVTQLGYMVEELQGQSIKSLGISDDLIHNEHLDSVETTIKTKLGVDIPVLVTRTILDKDKELLFIIHNLSSLKRAEEEKNSLVQKLQQSQKIESIGRLAGGVAHDFNNILAIVMGYFDRLKTNDVIHAIADKKILNYFDAIEKSLVRATALTNQLLGFARKGNYQMQALDLSVAINEAFNLLRLSTASTIRIETHCPSDLWPITADINQIMQLLMNLGLNAKDAMPQGGTLLIEVKNMVADEAFCQQHVQLLPQVPL